MEVAIISETCIKPSSPTLPHLKTHRLSSTDQRATSSYIPIVLFFNPVADKTFTDETISSSLKRSLSETLSHFYPFAGRIKGDNIAIDCNDDGAHYLEAKIVDPSLTLSQYLTHRVKDDLTTTAKLLPRSDAVRMYALPPPGSHTLHIQVTFFPCGGVAIGALFSHKIIDGPTVCSFFRAWATATAAGDGGGGSVEPEARDSMFCAESVFPQNVTFVEKSAVSLKHSQLIRAQTVPAVVRRFVFNASAIANLKEKFTSNDVRVSNSPMMISRVQAVSTLLCKSILRAFESRLDIAGTTLIAQPVNLRTRANPPLPPNSFGNLIMRATTTLRGGDAEEDTSLNSLARAMKDSMSRIDEEFVRRIRGVEGMARFAELAKEMDEEEADAERHVMCNSLSRLGYYEVDFGRLGKPVWVTCICYEESDTAVMNVIMVNDTRSGEGLEAWVLLGKDDMAVLESDDELLSCVSAIDPSPLALP